MARNKDIDGGWAWVILAASFLCNVIVDGMCFSFGIFYLEFLDYFKESKGKTAWVGSVLNGMYMIMGPITAALANRYGCRPVSIVGAIWATTAFIISRWSPNVDVLILTFGVLGGAGFGLLYLPSIVIVGYYFDKKRALATGIATCGSGVGGFIFAPLCRALIQEYTWQGALLIISGVVLNGVVFGLLYLPISSTDVIDSRETATEINIQFCKEEGKSLIKTEDGIDKIVVADTVTRSQSLEHMCNQTKHSNMSNAEKLRRAHLGDSWHSLASLAHAQSVDNINGKCKKEDSVKNSSLKEKANCCVDILKGVQSSMDISLLRNPVFNIYGLSCILCMAGFFIPFVYLVDRAIGMGIDEQRAAFLISVLGITNTVGRILVGWLSDRPWTDCLLLNNCALVIGGIATALCPFCYNYAMLCTYATVFGLCIAAFVSLRSIILVDLIGLERLTSAFGLIVLCQGISTFVGAPFAGFLFDITGSYDVSFYVAGSAICLAGIICFPLRRLSKAQCMNRDMDDRNHIDE